MLREIPQQAGARTDLQPRDTSVPRLEKTKEEVLKDMCFSKIQASRYEILANNQDIVEIVKEDIAEMLGVPQQTISDVINGEKAQMHDFAKEFTPMLYNIWNTQETIAEMLGVPQPTICRVINIQNAQMHDLNKEFTPILYNIWNSAKQDNVTDLQLVISADNRLEISKAERKAGEMDREKPGEYKKLHDETFYKKPNLEQLGISRIQSHRWQMEATTA